MELLPGEAVCRHLSLLSRPPFLPLPALAGALISIGIRIKMEELIKIDTLVKIVL